MKVGVWGAGLVGSGLVRRLASLGSVSELHWVNRSRVDGRAIDIEHGLAFAPTCHSIHRFGQEDAGSALRVCDLVVLTLGTGVPEGGLRSDAYSSNRTLFEETVLPVLHAFEGVVLVITNPVDLMARGVGCALEGGEKRVLGLGTVVETARLRAALADQLRPERAARDIEAFAVGTHDPHFRPVAHRARLWTSARGWRV